MTEDEEKRLQFYEMGLDDRILEAIIKLKWVEPTLIQEKAIPYFLRGKDILTRARTGSGKSGAFLVPLIHKILEKKSTAQKQITRALILAPSKELCKQLTTHIKQLCHFCKREVVCVDVSPQIPLEAQKPLLEDNPDIVIGTPLKIMSHIKEGNLNFMESLQFLIVDEADLMFAYDHEKDLKSVLQRLPSICQSFITSATMADDIKELKSLILHNPIVLKLEEPPLPPTSQLTQYVIKIEDLDKAVLLYALIRMNLIQGKTMIFVNTVDKSYKVRMFLGMFGIKTCVLNSELPVNSRCHIVDEFNRGKYNIMVASDETSVSDPTTVKDSRQKSKRKRDKESGVARGIDFRFVSNVVNFDFPKEIKSYVHRVGRTARADAQGTALSLVSSKELKNFKKVEEELRKMMTQTTSVFKDYKFNMASLDGFRYRASDAWKQCTAVAVKDCRKREIKTEILNSQKLKTFFEDHPDDLEVLRHDVGGRALPYQPHLKNVPEYNVPSVLKRVALSSKKAMKKNQSTLKEKRTSKAKFLRHQADPLRSFVFKGFNK